MTKPVVSKVSALKDATILPIFAYASPNLSGGIWFNYQYQQNTESHRESLGLIELHV